MKFWKNPFTQPRKEIEENAKKNVWFSDSIYQDDHADLSLATRKRLLEKLKDPEMIERLLRNRINVVYPMHDTNDLWLVFTKEIQFEVTDKQLLKALDTIAGK